MANELTTQNYFTDHILKVLNKNTPKEKIKKRPDGFDYVEIGYVVSQLDEAFNRLWEWEIIEQQLGDRQVWVKGRLTVHLAPNFSLKKDAYGSADIQRYRTGHAKAGQVMDIGNTLKSASSDALKKAASMLGIASDVYFPNEFQKPEQEETE